MASTQLSLSLGDRTASAITSHAPGGDLDRLKALEAYHAQNRLNNLYSYHHWLHPSHLSGTYSPPLLSLYSFSESFETLYSAGKADEQAAAHVCMPPVALQARKENLAYSSEDISHFLRSQESNMSDMPNFLETSTTFPDE